MTKQELLKTAKPIIFDADSIRAILDGRKTQTRRVAKVSVFAEKHEFYENCLTWFCTVRVKEIYKYPHYKIGDILYVRETWAAECDDCPHNQGEGYDDVTCAMGADCDIYIYKADRDNHKWRPSIHMPKEAARLFLRVTGVRVERLRDISDNDCVAEGLTTSDMNPLHKEVTGRTNGETSKKWLDYCGLKSVWQCAFWGVWDNLNAKRNGRQYAWGKNPWVFVYAFEKVEPLTIGVETNVIN
jgi:hypothetical protein